MVNVIGNIRVQLYPNVAPFRRRGEQDYEILRNVDSFVLRSGDRWRSSAKTVLALHSSERTLSWTDPRSCLQSALSAFIERLKTDHVTAKVRNAVPSLESKLLGYHCSLLDHREPHGEVLFVRAPSWPSKASSQSSRIPSTRPDGGPNG